jgi:hypothetical protein
MQPRESGAAFLVAKMALVSRFRRLYSFAARSRTNVRGDLFERRRRMMTVWSTFCSAPKVAARTDAARAWM